MLSSGKILGRYFNNNSLRTLTKLSYISPPILNFSNRPLVLTRQSNFSSLVPQRNSLNNLNTSMLKKPAFNSQIIKRYQSTKWDNESHLDSKFDRIIRTFFITLAIAFGTALITVLFGEFSFFIFLFLGIWIIIYIL